MSTKINMQHCHLDLKFSSVASQQQQRLTGATLRHSSSSSIPYPLSVKHKITVFKLLALPKGQDHQAKTLFLFEVAKNCDLRKPHVWETVEGVPDWELTRQALTNYLLFLLFCAQIWFICWIYPVTYVLYLRQFFHWDRNHHLLFFFFFLIITMLDNLTEVFHLLYCKR